VIPLPPGSLFAMEGKTQKKLSHEMPKRKRAADRGSVTYRQFQ
jgi:alkylated DNA repair dioxygenase AlkB